MGFEQILRAKIKWLRQHAGLVNNCLCGCVGQKVKIVSNTSNIDLNIFITNVLGVF
ncbi:hypothetical protein COMNV_01362 [Commensalibacter sp. Nvir]|uniref:hypothetical protein n=1 Tax=Commensalibacter sp. Nvir TaxID=3069817 RepID=UPI002D49EEBB|nr:hypothetical protein COMNV_01362 [Commensalibacter sp. Nvir]